MNVSVVCPFYNEAEIIEDAIQQLLQALDTLECDWELILVDDGSTDRSGELARQIAIKCQRLRVLAYSPNRGRGHALRTGIAAARGEIIVTTEIDLSWGATIVHDLVAAMKRWPDTDVVVASPHLPGGGYKNVPGKRVLLSRLGNRVIRACVSNSATMNTGMTRAYRARVIRTLPLVEDGKEFHLEVILKAHAFGLRIREIPAVLEWKEYKHRGRQVKRKSSSRVNRLIVSHSLFSLFANPVRYVWTLSLLFLLLGIVSTVGAFVLFALQMVAAYTALVSMLFYVLAMLMFLFGVLLKQGNMVQRELWLMQRYQLMHSGHRTVDSNVSPEECDQGEQIDVPQESLDEEPEATAGAKWSGRKASP